MFLKWHSCGAETPWVGIMLQEALDELTAIGSELGYRAPRRRADTEELNSEIVLAREYLSPLVIPQEVIDFWAWDPSSFEVLDAAEIRVLSPLTALKEVEFMDELGFPGVLLPVAREEKRLLAVELGTDTHPGMRLFEIGFHGENLSLLGIGVSDLIELFSEAIDLSSEKGNPGEWGTGIIDWDIYNRVTGDRYELNGEMTVDPFEKTQWHEHWLTAAGFTPEWLQPLGMSHSIADFEMSRQAGTEDEPAAAVLHGRWQLRAGGGELDGVFGTLTDDSGTIVIFVPSDCPHAGFGPDRMCEIEVTTRPGALPLPQDSFAGLNGDGTVLSGIRESDAGPPAIATAIRPVTAEFD